MNRKPKWGTGVGCRVSGKTDNGRGIGMRCLLTLDELRARCEEWKATLGLQAWTVQIYLDRFYDMPCDCLGEYRGTPSKQSALIKILDPDDYDPATSCEYDMERTLVHELLHMRFDTDRIPDDGTFERMAMEQGIEAVAHALLKMKRQLREYVIESAKAQLDNESGICSSDAAPGCPHEPPCKFAGMCAMKQFFFPREAA